MLFQNGALLTDLSVFENVAFPLREHTKLARAAHSSIGAHQAAGRGPARRRRSSCPRSFPAAWGGGLRSARAIVMDPEILIYDEPFVGLDPISLGVILRLIRRLNDALGLTSIVVSHDVQEISTRRGSRCSCCRGARSWRTVHRKDLQNDPSEMVQAVRRRPTRWPGAVSLSGSGLFQRASVAGRESLTIIRELWESAYEALVGLGAVTRFLLRLIGHAPRALLRFDLIVATDLQLRRACRWSSSCSRGCSSAWCSACRASSCCSVSVPEEALGIAAAIGLVKELGPVVTALLFAGRAGTALASELGLMRATDQLSAMEMMAVDPIQRVVVPRFLGGVIAMPLARRHLQRDRHLWRTAGRRADHGRRFGQFLVADARREST